MKKLSTYLLLILIVLSFVSCGENKNSNTKNDSSKASNISSTKDGVKDDKPKILTPETIKLNHNDKYTLSLNVPSGWKIATEKDRISDYCEFQKDTIYPKIGVSLSSNGGLTKTLSEMIEAHRKIEMNTDPSTVEEAKEKTIGEFKVAYFLHNNSYMKFIAVVSIDDNYYIHFTIDDFVPEGSEQSIDMEKEMQSFFENIKVSKFEE